VKLTVEFPVDVLSDTKWKYGPTARPNRGLHDYVRTIVMARPLNEQEKEKLRQLIMNFDNPGYCNWSFRTQDNQNFYLTSTMDSSD
jgi:hypothetical protein